MQPGYIFVNVFNKVILDTHFLWWINSWTSFKLSISYKYSWVANTTTKSRENFPFNSIKQISIAITSLRSALSHPFSWHSRGPFILHFVPQRTAHLLYVQLIACTRIVRSFSNPLRRVSVVKGRQDGGQPSSLFQHAMLPPASSKTSVILPKSGECIHNHVDIFSCEL